MRVRGTANITIQVDAEWDENTEEYEVWMWEAGKEPDGSPESVEEFILSDGDEDYLKNFPVSGDVQDIFLVDVQVLDI